MARGTGGIHATRQAHWMRGHDRGRTRTPARWPGSAQGFTLMELVIVLAIVGLLSAIAYPSYASYVQRGYRAEARATLLEAQQFMARHYAAHGRYTTEGDEPPVLPRRLRTVPEGEAAETARYLLSVSEATDDSYALKAELALGRNDPCGSLTLTHTGLKGRTGETVSVADCWR